MLPLHESWIEASQLAKDTNRAANIEIAFFIGYGIILPIMAIVGISGNIFCFCTWCNKSLRCSFGVYACALALANSMYLIVYVVRHTTYSIEHSQGKRLDTSYFLAVVAPHMSAQLFPLGEIGEVCISLYTIVMTTDRFIAAFRPMKALVWCRIDTSIKITVTVTLLSVGVNFLSFFRFHMDESVFQNKTIYRACPSDMNGNVYYSAYDRYAYFILRLIIPWCVLIVMTLVILKNIQNVYRSHFCTNESLLQQVHDLHLADTTILNVSYVIFNTCRLILVFTLYFKQPVSLTCRKDYSALDVTSPWPLIDVTGTLLHLLNSCTNFAVYSVSCSKFRLTVYKYLNCPVVSEMSRKVSHKRTPQENPAQRVPDSFRTVVNDFFKDDRPNGKKQMSASQGRICDKHKRSKSFQVDRTHVTERFFNDRRSFHMYSNIPFSQEICGENPSNVHTKYWRGIQRTDKNNPLNLHIGTKIHSNQRSKQMHYFKIYDPLKERKEKSRIDVRPKDNSMYHRSFSVNTSAMKNDPHVELISSRNDNEHNILTVHMNYTSLDTEQKKSNSKVMPLTKQTSDSVLEIQKLKNVYPLQMTRHETSDGFSSSEYINSIRHNSQVNDSRSSGQRPEKHTDENYETSVSFANSTPNQSVNANILNLGHQALVNNVSYLRTTLTKYPRYVFTRARSRERSPPYNITLKHYRQESKENEIGQNQTRVFHATDV